MLMIPVGTKIKRKVDIYVRTLQHTYTHVCMCVLPSVGSTVDKDLLRIRYF